MFKIEFFIFIVNIIIFIIMIYFNDYETFLQYLAAMSNMQDKKLFKLGYNPNKMRADFYTHCNKDTKNQSYMCKMYNSRCPEGYSESFIDHYLDDNICDNDMFPFDDVTKLYNDGCLFYYNTYESRMIIITYDTNTNMFHTIKIGIETDWFAEDNSLMYSNSITNNTDLLDLINNYPRIIMDLINDDDIGLFVLKDYIKNCNEFILEKRAKSYFMNRLTMMYIFNRLQNRNTNNKWNNIMKNTHINYDIWMNIVSFISF